MALVVSATSCPARSPAPAVAGNRNDRKAWELSGAKDAAGRTTVIAGDGYRGAGLVIPHRRERGQAELSARKEDHNRSHRRVRDRIEHVLARMRTWKILRDCRPQGGGVHHAMLGVAGLHNLALAGWPGNNAGHPPHRGAFTEQRSEGTSSESRSVRTTTDRTPLARPGREQTL